MHALIIAAGVGARLAPMWKNLERLPKALIPIGGQALIHHSLVALRSIGIDECTIVTGFRAEVLRCNVGSAPGIAYVHNPDFAHTGTLESLMLGLDSVDDTVIVLESDILYEERGLKRIRLEGNPRAILCSGRTYAGDEAYVAASENQVTGLSKDPRTLPSEAMGEFVGISLLDGLAQSAIRKYYSERLPRSKCLSYDSDALNSVARNLPFKTVLIEDLLWGEIDDLDQFERVAKQVWPTIRSKSDSPPR